mmetsp:Transcript_28675/g.37585  ORF Transcript_28675/g.37585 Transcript_28675/m.37585 type:complete len:92 (-) Transcript_28675:136-411(-)
MYTTEGTVSLNRLIILFSSCFNAESVVAAEAGGIGLLTSSSEVTPADDTSIQLAQNVAKPLLISFTIFDKFILTVENVFISDDKGDRTVLV